MKFDLTDLIDQRQEQMQRTFETELLGIKQQYRESIKNVDSASQTLETLFSDKMIKVKTKIAKFFAKTEIMVTDCNKQVVDIGQMINMWQKNQQGPLQKCTAQIFTLQSQMAQAERERETEFGILKESIQRVTKALYDSHNDDFVDRPNVESQKLMQFINHSPNVDLNFPI